jgi:hypothetical protein
LKRKHAISILILILLALLVFSIVYIVPKSKTFREQPAEKSKSSSATVVLDKNGNEVQPIPSDKVKNDDNLGGN